MWPKSNAKVLSSVAAAPRILGNVAAVRLTGWVQHQSTRAPGQATEEASSCRRSTKTARCAVKKTYSLIGPVQPGPGPDTFNFDCVK
jgi:hypothetical protein